MREIGIDIETYSSYDLKSCGVYRYVEAPDFAILLFGYCVDGGPVSCVDLAQGEQIPAEVFAALTTRRWLRPHLTQLSSVFVSAGIFSAGH